jgi:acyl-CoA thioesterase I
LRALILLILSLNSLAFGEERIVFFGDSLTAGYGLSIDEAYPSLIQEKLKREGYSYIVKNSGVSGDTTAAGLRRLRWAMKEEPTIFVLALGANDGLRGLDLEETERNLIGIISEVRTLYPKSTVVLAGMELPINLGDEYGAQFREVFGKVAKLADAKFIPFLLEGVAGSREYNQPDGIHPTAVGHKKMADTVWKTLQPLLRK